MTVALPASTLDLARLEMTEAPSMPMKHQNMIIMQLTIWSGMVPRSVAPAWPMAARLSWTVPQKSAVKTPALNMTSANTMNRPRAATLATMTMALMNEALSTPRMTRNVMPQRMTEAIRMHGTVLPDSKGG